MCIPRILIVYYLLVVPANTYIYIYIYIKILNYITNARTCFDASAPTSANAKSNLPEDGSETPKHVGAFVV
jgi:hypothetical protein